MRGFAKIQVNLLTKARQEVKRRPVKSLDPQPRQKAEKARLKENPQPNDLEKLTRCVASR